MSIGLIALGALSVIYRDFAYTWQPVPAFHPGRDVLAIACGLFMIGAGVALFFRATVSVAVRPAQGLRSAQCTLYREILETQ